MLVKRVFLFATVVCFLLPFLIIDSCRHEPYGIDLLDTVCFNTQVLPTLLTSCGISACHDAVAAEGGFMATDYESVLSAVKPFNAIGSKLYRVITDINSENFMPPGRPLSKEQRSLIMVWIEQGALSTVCMPDENGGNGGTPVNYDTICFNQHVLPMLLSSCGKAGCHDAISHEEDYVLTSYSTLMQNEEGIVPFNPGRSKIYKVINETDPGDRMPPPPDSPLTNDQIELFRIWISQGALNSDCPWTACDTVSDISFTRQVWPLVQSNCLGCHTASNPSGGVNLSNYLQVKHYAETLSGGTPILVGTLRHQQGFVPMPPSGMLNACQLRTFELWIAQGLKNN